MRYYYINSFCPQRCRPLIARCSISIVIGCFAIPSLTPTPKSLRRSISFLHRDFSPVISGLPAGGGELRGAFQSRRVTAGRWTDENHRLLAGRKSRGSGAQVPHKVRYRFLDTIKDLGENTVFQGDAQPPFRNRDILDAVRLISRRAGALI